MKHLPFAVLFAALASCEPCPAQESKPAPTEKKEAPAPPPVLNVTQLEAQPLTIAQLKYNSAQKDVLLALHECEDACKALTIAKSWPARESPAIFRRGRLHYQQHQQSIELSRLNRGSRPLVTCHFLSLPTESIPPPLTFPEAFRIGSSAAHAP